MSDELRRLPPDLEALLHAERSADGPNEGARGRVRQRLEQTLGIAIGAAAATAVGAAAGTSAGASAGTGAAPASGSLSATGKLTALGGKSLVTAKLTLLLVVAGGGLAAAGYFAHRAARSQDTARLERAHRGWPPAAAPSASAASPTVTATAATPASDAPPSADVVPSAVAETSGAAARPMTARSSRSSAVRGGTSRVLPRPAAATATAVAAHPRTLADERALLEKARTALAAGDADGALAAVSRHARLYPAGQLAEERDSLRVRAAASRGDDADVQTLGAEFTRRYPQSLFLPSVREAVAASQAQTQ